ncbi:MAG: hypothetical protein ACKVHO_05995 [Verrucomicrobiia bacterium]|jgi:hypothetical protein
MTDEALRKAIGFHAKQSPLTDDRTITYINLKLAALGCPTVPGGLDEKFQDLAESLLARHRETDRLLSKYLCPADERIQNWLDQYLKGTDQEVRLPTRSFVLDRHGVGRALSLPPDRDKFESDIVSSYRTRNGILHNPAKDRRTTKGVFHVAEAGLPIPNDKKSVPVKTFGLMLKKALQPPGNLLQLPFTDRQKKRAECWVSLLLRPLVCPEVRGFTPRKSMEIRFFAPGNLVCNLDFVESIFGNAGDPYLPENDAGLDVEHWTGHTGCVILAPHLVEVTKKEVGLPRYEEATELQRRDGMCWQEPDEKYNDGGAFKLTARDANGVVITMIADNYFGYCKKEVKTQISFAANLFGLTEEEHAGGTIAYPSYDLGEEFSGVKHVRPTEHTFEETKKLYADAIDFSEGHGRDKRFEKVLYVPEDVTFDLRKKTVSWTRDGKETQLPLRADRVYVRPSGYKVYIEKPPGQRAWRLIGTVAEGLFCHKPCTVSGGGKSEISKSISDAIIQGPVFVADFEKDFDEVEKLIDHDYSQRFEDPAKRVDSRSVLSHERSLGSVIKLLTPSGRDYTKEYNEWLDSIPQHVRELVFVVKRFFEDGWGTDWRSKFSVDIINGVAGNQLKLGRRNLVSNFLRVGFDQDGSWRVFSLRKDFHPATKLQLEDDISASVVVPVKSLEGLPAWVNQPAIKFVENCEYRLFQRPDEAIHPGYDKQTEKDFGQSLNFYSNYHPLSRDETVAITEDFEEFGKFTEPMQAAIREAAEAKDQPEYFVSNSEPRRVDGGITKNPRYLQNRQELENPQNFYLASMATRLQRRVLLHRPIYNPVGAVLPGRRNNGPDLANQVRALSVYNPIHYMEFPELFMEYIASITGKSPSTTGAGSEGALTKAPFNAMPPIFDLNNALVSSVLTGEGAFLSSAGCIGPHNRVDHDVSLLMPEIWCRMLPEERDPQRLIDNGCLERMADREFDGKPVLSSRLGYRITYRFVRIFFARVFNYPQSVFSEEMLQPELQDEAVFADAMDNIVTTHESAARHYFEDGSIAMACPPLKALLHIMVHGNFEGKTLDDDAVRDLFKRETLLASDWYRERLTTRQERDVKLWERHQDYLETFLGNSANAEVIDSLNLNRRLAVVKDQRVKVKSPEYLDSLQGTIGAQPMPT